MLKLCFYLGSHSGEAAPCTFKLGLTAFTLFLNNFSPIRSISHYRWFMLNLIGTRRSALQWKTVSGHSKCLRAELTVQDRVSIYVAKSSAVESGVKLAPNGDTIINQQLESLALLRIRRPQGLVIAQMLRSPESTPNRQCGTG